MEFTLNRWAVVCWAQLEGRDWHGGIIMKLLFRQLFLGLYRFQSFFLFRFAILQIFRMF